MGDCSRLLLDRRPGRDLLATISPKVPALPARADVALHIGLRRSRCNRSRSEWEATKEPMSVVEYVPADPASTSLVIEDQFSNLRGGLSRCHSRSRMRAASVSPADAEAPTALPYAAAPGSWAATCATAALDRYPPRTDAASMSHPAESVDLSAALRGHRFTSGTHHAAPGDGNKRGRSVTVDRSAILEPRSDDRSVSSCWTDGGA